MATSETLITETIDIGDGNASAVSWSAIIAGAVVGLAATIALIVLGAGVGLALFDPWAPVGAEARQISIGAVVWFLTAQLWGLFVGGYVAGRLRRLSTSSGSDETRFRDAAHGGAVWAVALVIGVTLSGMAALSAARTAGQAAAAVGTGTAAVGAAGVAAIDQGEIGLLVRQLTAGGQAPAQPPAGTEGRPLTQDLPPQEIAQILQRAWTKGEMAASDRDYLAGVVARRTGISEAEAKERVARAEQQVKEAAQQAELRARETADKAKKTGAFTAFWGFIALLLGCTGAVGGALLGGVHRREL
ncbi:hypothetical protein [Vineibacter terrae]|uniref:hypothetical protein n=1 Tax=Vineibacter terrae TaxID=2586908 RepID=UPI002E31A2EB|nr:hypothetical protein [Vineibacter terrae]HEX2891127.1 hypothetical protein [Vineibacter terrae]